MVGGSTSKEKCGRESRANNWKRGYVGEGK